MELSASDLEELLAERRTDYEDLPASLESYLAGPARASEEFELKSIPHYIEIFCNKGDKGSAERIIALLADAAGREEEWRDVFRQQGLLVPVLLKVVSFTTHASTAVHEELARQYLRVIGNCVADNDDNRAIVMEYLTIFITCLGRDGLRATSLGVLFNLCNDYEPALKRAAEEKLDETIVDFLVAGLPDQAVTEIAHELLYNTTEQRTMVQGGDLSMKVFKFVLDVACRQDTRDDLFQYLALIAMYLNHQSFQLEATPDLLLKILELIALYQRMLKPGEVEEALRLLSTQSESIEDEAIASMVQLVNGFSALCLTDDFAKNCRYTEDLVRNVTQHVLHPYGPTTICSCVMLGNIATTDDVAIRMVRDVEVHMRLLPILAESNEPAILYAVAALMRRLTIPEQFRTLLGKEGVIIRGCRLLMMKDPSVRGEAAAILCKLVSNNVENIRQVVSTPLPESLRPVQPPASEHIENPTALHYAVAVSLAPTGAVPSTSMKNAMIEIGRMIVAICRYFGQNQSADTEALFLAMANVPLVARPVARLLRQRFFAEVRSEGLLGLTLMATWEEGASLVVEEFKADPKLFEHVREFARIEEEGAYTMAMAERDCRNAVVLMDALAKNGGDAMSSEMKEEVKALRAELSKSLFI